MHKVRCPITLRFSDIDLAGHVHNAQYLNYFEAGRIAYLGEFVPDDHNWLSEGLILARNEVDYVLPVRFNDEVYIEVNCAKIGTSSFTLAYNMFRVKDKQVELCCNGVSVMVCYSYEAKQTIPIPTAWRNELEKRI